MSVLEVVLNLDFQDEVIVEKTAAMILKGALGSADNFKSVFEKQLERLLAQLEEFSPSDNDSGTSLCQQLWAALVLRSSICHACKEEAFCLSAFVRRLVEALFESELMDSVSFQSSFYPRVLAGN